MIIPQGAYYIETIIAILNTNDDFSVQIGVQWRERILYFHSCSRIQSILRFESSVLEKRVDNPRRYFLRIVCNQIVVTNDTVRHVLSMPTDYYTFSEFIEALGSEMVNVLPLVSMTIEEEYVKFNVQGELRYFDRVSNDTTMNGAHDLGIESHVDDSVFDPK